MLFIYIYDRPTLVFPGIKHAHLLKTKFVGLNVQLIKKADFMPGKTKVSWTIIYKFFFEKGGNDRNG